MPLSPRFPVTVPRATRKKKKEGIGKNVLLTPNPHYNLNTTTLKDSVCWLPSRPSFKPGDSKRGSNHEITRFPHRPGCSDFVHPVGTPSIKDTLSAPTQHYHWWGSHRGLLISIWPVPSDISGWSLHKRRRPKQCRHCSPTKTCLLIVTISVWML